MKNALWLALALAIVLGVSTSQADARGGGGRGGPGGGRPGGGFSAGRSGDRSLGDRQVGNRQAGDRDNGIRDNSERGHRNAAQRAKANAAIKKSGQFANKTSQLRTNYTGKNQPFSAAWYANHPRAWQNAHPRADAWAVASLGAAGAWLGAAALNDDTVYTAETEADDQSDENLTQEGETDLPADDSFLSLGVFALAPQQENDATAIVQLAINHDGIVRGTYVDLLTNQEQAIEGAVDKKSQRVAFRVGDNGSVTFDTQLASLTQTTGPITLHYENGKTRQWKLARFDDK